ncbi:MULTISPECIES: SDR family oxidoreductase [unclassified Novosphingobium]|uniref:SDR family oxidoreductase n=1 Tax=unclassified Novosphingobium TaxID=2644732 RepID=UPI001494C57D|nr:MULTISPECIES: SDR family oxidoreductase [unclassified Novosphingobium]MBB3356916.1 NAD(P)-dependent dehydrogenase (short-subunit alcohol dehydrogenase family) [Novosphingobium sp. BK256]MBB3373317.1 NAD(P)-dependent dehydrogenase (short-subunit alcohol dehydrogenase family) [Novosphingobium sp. BK280]MBB3377686.1 NAD(P)-dependent dehydrogenase (short-subunit alcohol dehydrogenase family) [Novosphingobium sp. BK258]MBB3418903.1 NAD(P)-dependent dehydrogenase (short-subunit alcohol dehydrogena
MLSAQQQQRILLLGATKGIGFALARQLGSGSNRITLTGRSQSSVDEALSHLNAGNPGADVDGFVLDLKEHEAARQALGAAGPVDHLVLCGSSDAAWGPFETLTAKVLEDALSMKLVGYLNAVQGVLPNLAVSGSITFIGGTAARASLSGSVGIAAVNAGLEGAMRSLARELAPRRVNVVSPGMTSTEFWDKMGDRKAEYFASFAAQLPLRRVGQPEESAEAIAFVIANSYVTGSVIDVDGGWHLG